MRLDNGEGTAKVTFDYALLNELATLRFLECPRATSGCQE